MKHNSLIKGVSLLILSAILLTGCDGKVEKECAGGTPVQPQSITTIFKDGQVAKILIQALGCNTETYDIYSSTAFGYEITGQRAETECHGSSYVHGGPMTDGWNRFRQVPGSEMSFTVDGEVGGPSSPSGFPDPQGDAMDLCVNNNIWYGLWPPSLGTRK